MYMKDVPMYLFHVYGYMDSVFKYLFHVTRFALYCPASLNIALHWLVTRLSNPPPDPDF